MSAFRTLRDRFLRDTDGGFSIEFVMWLPVMVALIGFSADATMLFFEQQLLYDGARDASRQVALGQKTDEGAETDLASRYDRDGVQSDVAIVDGYVTSTVSVPFSSVLIFGDLFAGEARLNASVTMWVETPAS